MQLFLSQLGFCITMHTEPIRNTPLGLHCDKVPALARNGTFLHFCFWVCYPIWFIVSVNWSELKQTSQPSRFHYVSDDFTALLRICWLIYWLLYSLLVRIISLFAALKIYVSVTSAYNGPSRVVSSNCQPGNILIGPLGSASHILLCCEGRNVLQW